MVARVFVVSEPHSFAILLRSDALFLSRDEVVLVRRSTVIRQNLCVQHQEPMWDAITAHHEKIQSISWYVERMSVAQWDGLYSTISLWLPSERY